MLSGSDPGAFQAWFDRVSDDIAHNNSHVAQSEHRLDVLKSATESTTPLTTSTDAVVGRRARMWLAGWMLYMYPGNTDMIGIGPNLITPALSSGDAAATIYFIENIYKYLVYSINTRCDVAESMDTLWLEMTQIAATIAHAKE